MYYNKFFSNPKLYKKIIYMPPCIIIIDSRFRIFQDELLNNILYLDKMLLRYGKIKSSLCSFCKMENERTLRLFYDCTKPKRLWNQLNVAIPLRTLQGAFLDCNWTQTHNHLVRKRTLNHFTTLTK